jgi:multidrug resistance protein, MATE family
MEAPFHHRARGFRPEAGDVRRLLALALPIVTVQVGMMLMGVVDSVLLGHLSAADLAAGALGNLYFFGVAGLGMGTLFALDPVVAQAVGAGDREAVSRGVQRGLVLAVSIGAVTSLGFLPAHPVFEWLGQPADVVPRATRYVAACIPGVLPFYGFIVLRQSLQAMGRLAPIVATIVIANLFNGVLAWVLIFGHGGAPALGAAGAAWATSAARWSMMLGLLALGWRDLAPHVSRFRREALEAAPLGRMLRLGTPIGMQYLLEMGVFSVVALLMGRIGTQAMAAHQIAINIASLTFMVPLGVSSAAAVMVGQAVGAGDEAGARRGAGAALLIGAGFMLASGCVLLGIPGPLAGVYSRETAVLGVAVTLIPIAGVFQVFDGVQVVSIGVLRGVGDTRTPLLVNVLGFWLVGLPVSLALAFPLGRGPQGLWWGLVVGLVMVAAFLVVRAIQRLSRPLARVVIDRPADPSRG